MAQLIVEGPSVLKGEVAVAGSKNHVLPMMAACLLVEGKTTLHNVPHISDVDVMVDIFTYLGVKVTRHDADLQIDATNLHGTDTPIEDARRMRASVLALGGAIGRIDRVEIAQPGGDIIGARSLGVHVRIFEALGLTVVMDDHGVTLTGRPKGETDVNAELGVTPTENAILAAVLAPGVTRIVLAACEPHVVALCNFLNDLGASITGITSHTLTIKGVNRLHEGEGTIIPDQLEAGTLAIASAASNGDVLIHGFKADDHDMLMLKLREMNVNMELIGSDSLHIRPSTGLKGTKIQTQPYPGLPTDLQAPLAVLMTQAEGESEIFETMYEGRLNYLFELQRMGAEVGIRDPHVGIIHGPTRLHGTNVISFDIRAGATILLAAMIAHGTTTIDRVEHIDRGYEHFDERLNALGANMRRV